jgi:hypothetical protein
MHWLGWLESGVAVRITMRAFDRQLIVGCSVNEHHGQ